MSGFECPYCYEPVKSGDRIGPHRINGQLVHWECGLRAIVGGINHLNGKCSCCGGSLPPDPNGVPRRLAAQMAANAYIARHPEWQE